MAEIFPDPPPRKTTLRSGESLNSSSEALYSPNQEYYVWLSDDDGDLQIKFWTEKLIWSGMQEHSVPAIVGGSILMQDDGNLVALISDPSRKNKVVWSTGTDTSYDKEGNEVPNANPGAVLSLQDNGVLVIRRGGGWGRIVWASKLEDGMSPFAGPDQVKSGLWIRSTLNDDDEK